ncbi:MAG: phosphomannomutase, partial [Desulfomonilaceae bacterium]
MTHFSSEISKSFKAYDIRGRIPDEFNEDVAYLIGRAYGEFVKPRTVCVGHDIRLTSPSISQALERGLADHGCDVVDIGLSATEEIYFVTSHKKLDGGVMVTASHNPADYNGMKLVREESRPISGDTGLKDIERLVLEHAFGDAADPRGSITHVNTKDAYIDHLLSYIDVKKIAPLKVVMNCGNGCAGPILERLEPRIPIEFIKIFPEPDGRFPNGIPNPLLPENRDVTINAVIAHKADLGIAWDGDCDRCFF